AGCGTSRARPRYSRPMSDPGRVDPLRTIRAFVRDDEGHWVAELECHHRRHVRHRPPMSSYPWVESTEGRQAKIGTPIECGRCRQRIWPDGLERYRETSVFDRSTTPKGLLAEHNTRAGVWGRVELV